MSGFSDGDGAWDEDDGYGILDADTEDNWSDTKIDQANPLIRETAVAKKPPVALVAVFDENSRPLVARTVIENGKPKQLENYRPPTEDEFNAIMFGKNAKLVRGGVVGTEVPAGTNVEATMQRTPLGGLSFDWKRIALFSGVGVVAIGGGWWGYKKFKETKKGGKKK